MLLARRALVALVPIPHRFSGFSWAKFYYKWGVPLFIFLKPKIIEFKLLWGILRGVKVSLADLWDDPFPKGFCEYF